MKIKKRKKCCFNINENFKLSLKFIKEIKAYIWFALMVFVIFGLIGFVFPVFFQKQIFQLIQELISKTEGMNLIELIGYIFMNNLKSSFFAIILGILFGVFPLLSLIVNGYVLGFVASKTVASEGISVLWRLLPHGIFEIPAVMISIGIGLRLGMFLFFRKRKFRQLFLDSLRALVFIVIPLLMLAAIIEGALIHLLS